MPLNTATLPRDQAEIHVADDEGIRHAAYANPGVACSLEYGLPPSRCYSARRQCVRSTSASMRRTRARIRRRRPRTWPDPRLQCINRIQLTGTDGRLRCNPWLSSTLIC